MATDSGDGTAGKHVAGDARKRRPLWQEAILLLVVALVLAVVLKAFFVQVFYIPSESMEPGLIKNDRILVERVSTWGGGTPQRGDVVVFDDPGGWLPPSSAGPANPLARAMADIGSCPEGGHLVKRVIGVGGDVIHCCDDQGRIEVNGQALDEDSYVKDADVVECRGPQGPGDCEWTAGPVPEGHLFVMGETAPNSEDSSAHMCNTDADCNQSPYVPVDLVVGKVFVLIWPADRFGFLHRPATFEDVPDPS